MTHSAYSTSNKIPQACLDALSIQTKESEIKWTMRPAKGPKGSVRFIYQAVISEKGETLLGMEKRPDFIYLSLKTKEQIKFYKLIPSSPENCHGELLRTEKTTKKATNQKLEQSKVENRGFLDQDLRKLLKDSKEGIIFLWSPHMPYSVGSLYPLQKIAKKLKLPLTVLMDPLADDRETKKVIKRFSLPLKLTKKNRAERLLLQGASLHYPNYFFYKEGKVSHIQLFGAKGEEAIHDALKNLASK